MSLDPAIRDRAAAGRGVVARSHPDEELDGEVALADVDGTRRCVERDHHAVDGLASVAEEPEAPTDPRAAAVDHGLARVEVDRSSVGHLEPSRVELGHVGAGSIDSGSIEREPVLARSRVVEHVRARATQNADGEDRAEPSERGHEGATNLHGLLSHRGTEARSSAWLEREALVRLFGRLLSFDSFGRHS